MSVGKFLQNAGWAALAAAIAATSVPASAQERGRNRGYGDRGLVPLHQGLDRPVAPVADPAGQAEVARGLHRPATIEHALDATVDQEVAGDGHGAGSLHLHNDSGARRGPVQRKTRKP